MTSAALDPGAAALRFRSEARSHVGRVRRRNEDGFLNLPDACLWAVADGMGGHEEGAEASARAMEHLARVGRFESGYAFLAAVEAALVEVNAALVARRAELDAGITGATVVALLVHEDHAACLWAGDSRAYHLSCGQLRQLTRDHSLAQAIRDGGMTGPAPRGNVITRALGAAEALELDRTFAPVMAGDRFLICSDGLHSVVPHDAIADLLSRGALPQCADALLKRALEAGAPDNVTLVAIEAQG